MPRKAYGGILGAIFLSGMAAMVVSAQGDEGVYIHEVMWAGEEYIELYNESENTVSLQGWKITEQRSEDGEEQDVLIITDDVKIASKGYFLIERSEEATTVLGNLVEPFRLVNTGTLLRMYDSDTNLIDEVGEFGSWPAGTSRDGGASMERLTALGAWFTPESILGGRQGSPMSSLFEKEEPSSSPSASPTIIEIRISEFLPNPNGADGDQEFIEIENIGDTEVNIEGWQLDDADGGSKPYVIPSGVAFAPGSRKVFFSNETHISLNNNGDHVRILTPDDVIYLDVPYGESTEGSSFIYTPDSEYRLTSTPTPGEENVFNESNKEDDDEKDDQDNDDETKGDHSKLIRINEFLPNPKGADTDDEFIEILNNDSVQLNLAGWQLDDADGGSKPYSIPAATVVKPGGILVFYRHETDIALNNTTDTVRLLDPDSTVISSFQYDTAPEGQSYNQTKEGVYVLSTMITPGKKNIVTSGQVASAITVVLPISEVRKKTEDAIVTVRGMVTATPGLLGKGIAYIQDESAGIQIYLTREAYPALKVGDVIQVQGVVGTIYDETRLKVARSTDVVPRDEAISNEVQNVSTSGIQESLEGMVVEIEGRVSGSSGSTFYVNDGSGEAKVVVQTSTGIQKPSTKQGTYIRVRGIVSQTKTGYRILPIMQDDIKIIALPMSAGKQSIAAPKNSIVEHTLDTVPVQEIPTVQNLFSDDLFQNADAKALPILVRDRIRTNKRQVAFAGVGMAAVQMVRGAMAGEPLLRRKKLHDSGV